MSNYSLVLKIDHSQLERVAQQKLCIALGVSSGDGSTQFNVVAASKPGYKLNVTNKFSWSDNYKIAASRDRFSNGMQVSCSTEPLDISRGQRYTLSENWTGSVGSDSDAPKDGFAFLNKTNGAAAVLWNDINGRAASIYINRNAPFPQGREMVVPKPGSVGVWFERYADTGCMIDEFEGFRSFDVPQDSKYLVATYLDGGWQ